MKKKIISITICLLILTLTGCTQKNINKIYLSDKYYEGNNFTYVTSSDINNLKNEKYILFTYNNYCNLPIPCDEIFKKFMEDNNIVVLSIPFDEFKKTSYYKKIKYAPSIIIVDNSKIVAYLDANSDDDLDKYQDISKFTEWISKYIYLDKSSDN